MIPTAEESIFYQAIATVTLLQKLDEINYVHSEEFNLLPSSEPFDSLKSVLKNTGIGNPATMQMLLYAFLVMPKELLQKIDANTTEKWKTDFNAQASTLVYNFTTSYNGEDNNDNSTVGYYKHIRNAVAHSQCVYETIAGDNCVTFKDVNTKRPEQHCELTFKTRDCGMLLALLQIQLVEYLRKKSQI